MKVAVVGLGLIGGSIGLKLKNDGVAGKVIGVDMNSENAFRALELGLVDEIADLSEAVRRADVVCLAVPVTSMAKLIPDVLDLVNEGTTVLDMGSTKEKICEVAANHAKSHQFVAAHPIAGTENSGPDAAFAELFEGKTGIICDTEFSGQPALDVALEVMTALGMDVIHMDAKSHDLHIAYVSHISHISSFVLGKTVLEIEKDEASIFNLAGSGFESTVRLAKSSPQMWAPIFKENKTHISNALGAYIDNLVAFKKSIDDGHEQDLVETMQQANDIRRVLEGINNKTKTKQMV